MNTLTDIVTIHKLSRRFGNPMIDVSFPDGGVRFVYRVGSEEMVKEYSERYDGIEKEIERLTRLLNLEI